MADGGGAKIVEKFDNIGLSGQTVGSLTFNEKGLEWRGPASAKMVQVRGCTCVCVCVRVCVCAGGRRRGHDVIAACCRVPRAACCHRLALAARMVRR
jgi:hypothetical protein